MYIFDIENKSYLRNVLVENLKLLGVRCRLPKKIKENEKENIYSDNQVFQKPLHLLKKNIAYRLDGSAIKIPEFIAEACGIIEKDIKVEGIFRKAGSTSKQKERKLELNQGKKLSSDHHVLDACSLVKLFFRELPQPLIPYSYHDIFLKGLLLSTYEKEVNAIMLTCLLLPEDNLATLAFFMEFLLKVSLYSERNKMTIKNLAIILTPTLMPLNKEVKMSNKLEMAHHFKIIEMLIENAEQIGKVPDHIIGNVLSATDKKPKKKRRSGSITRMFSGLKKIVSSRSSGVSEWDDSTVSTPDSFSSLGKRKNADSDAVLSSSSKKKRLSDSTLGILTPLRCRMNGYAPYLISDRSSIPKRIRSRSPGDYDKPKIAVDKTSSDRGRSENRNSRLNLVRRCTIKKQKSPAQLGNTNVGGNMYNSESNKNFVERKCSLTSRGQKKPQNDFLIVEGDSFCKELTTNKVRNIPESELITVPKSEYEDIKNRVSALEEDLELLATVHTVQYAYEKTLEEAERLNGTSTEQLAKRLSKELKIRLSSENNVIRSPSARKIGSFRRRSKELRQRNSEPKSNLKRGRPNTVQTGLPSPRLRALSHENISSPKMNPVKRASSIRSARDDWESGDKFFAKEHLLRKLSPTTYPGRPSLAEIRCQNAGMVLEKAKLFNSLNESKESGVKLPRRQSIRLENLRRMNDADKNQKKVITRTKSLGSDKRPENSSLPTLENRVQPKTNQDLREIVYDVCTPKSQKFSTPLPGSRRETPSIKKPLVARSPRNFPKTPLSQMRSTNRTRATPMKVLPESGTTPRLGLRRSPRFLARNINTSSRPKE